MAALSPEKRGSGKKQCEPKIFWASERSWELAETPPAMTISWASG